MLSRNSVFLIGLEFLQELAVISWADASNHDRSDKGSRIGVITGLATKGSVQGHETQVAVIQWKSGSTPRQTLSSNGAEVQSFTIAEDMNFQIRGLLCELCGHIKEGSAPTHSICAWGSGHGFSRHL